MTCGRKFIGVARSSNTIILIYKRLGTVKKKIHGYKKELVIIFPPLNGHHIIIHNGNRLLKMPLPSISHAAGENNITKYRMLPGKSHVGGPGLPKSHVVLA